jgi:hypothetical protein
MGRSLRIIPPLIPGAVTSDTSEETATCNMITQIEADVDEAKDVLLGTKVMQAFFENRARGHEDVYLVGDKVMLATLHRRQEFKAGDNTRVAKFFP